MKDIDKKIYSFLETVDFKCQRCSYCCRKEPGAVFLTKEDIVNISGILNICSDDFLKKYCRIIHRNAKEVFSLKEKLNYDCIFWKEGCIVYEARPVQCRTYPYWPSIIESEEAWIEEAKRCKGINKKSSLTTEEKYNMYRLEDEAVIFGIISKDDKF